MWFLEYGRFVYVDKGVVYPDASRMPIYVYFVARILQLAGPANLWTVSVVQALIDAATVIAIALTARLVDQRWMWPATLLGCIWTTMVVYASFVLTDTLFLAFFSWGLFACFSAVRRKQTWPWLCLAGVMFTLAVYTRPVLMFFPIILWPMLTYLLAAVGQMSWRRAAGLSLIPPALMAIALLPRVAVNHNNYGVAVVTTQSGTHALGTFTTFLRACQDCNYEVRWQIARTALATRMARLSPAEQANPGVADLVRRQIAMEQLVEIPPLVIVRKVASSAMRTILQSAFYVIGYQMRQEPRYFSQIEGANIGERLNRFISAIRDHDFMRFWAMTQFAAIAAILLQVMGGIAAMTDTERRPFVLFLIGTAAYFLAINGPFASPRYGLPLAPSQILLTSAGLLFLWARRARDKAL